MDHQQIPTGIVDLVQGRVVDTAVFAMSHARLEQVVGLLNQGRIRQIAQAEKRSSANPSWPLFAQDQPGRAAAAQERP
jgi:hypothetical protein